MTDQKVSMDEMFSSSCSSCGGVEPTDKQEAPEGCSLCGELCRQDDEGSPVRLIQCNDMWVCEKCATDLKKEYGIEV